MAFSIQNFENVSPASRGTELLLYIDEGYVLKAINISIIDNNGNNLSESLSELTSITLELLGVKRTVKPTYSKYKGGYYFYLVENIDLAAGASPPFFTDEVDEYLEDTQLNPQPGNALFTKSKHQAILNNADLNRTTSFIYDVDRTTSQIRPVNYSSIISGSATLAQFQELNYSSIGILNSRYAGAKTNRTEYGTVPAVSVIAFEGKLFGADVENSRICSASNNIGTLDTFGFTIDSPGKTTKLIALPATQDYPTAVTSSFQGGNSDLELHGSEGLSLPATTTTISSVIVNSGTELRVGDVYVVKPNSNVSDYTDTEDYFEIKSFTRTGGSYTLNVTRGLLGQSRTVTESNINNELYIYRVKSDTVYQFNGSKISRVGRKKLFIPDTGQILLISNQGRVVRVEKSCGI